MAITYSKFINLGNSAKVLPWVQLPKCSQSHQTWGSGEEVNTALLINSVLSNTLTAIFISEAKCHATVRFCPSLLHGLAQFG